MTLSSVPLAVFSANISCEHFDISEHCTPSRVCNYGENPKLSSAPALSCAEGESMQPQSYFQLQWAEERARPTQGRLDQPLPHLSLHTPLHMHVCTQSGSFKPALLTR